MVEGLMAKTIPSLLVMNNSFDGSVINNQYDVVVLEMMSMTSSLLYVTPLMLSANIGPSRLWVPLFGIVSHLKSALFHGICPARFISSLKLLFSPGPGMGAPLSSYLEVALYKFHR